MQTASKSQEILRRIKPRRNYISNVASYCNALLSKTVSYWYKKKTKDNSVKQNKKFHRQTHTHKATHL